MNEPIETARLERFPLLQAMIERRSRRFAMGMTLDGGPLAYRSTRTPQPLTLPEEAAMAFAACGVTGYALAELPYLAGDQPESGGGNIMTHFVGRTIASGDAMHDCTMFVISDDGAWLLKRPQDYPREEVASLIAAAGEHRLLDLYEQARVRIAFERLDVPRQLPFVPPFNKWMANVPGVTYFVAVAELSALYINVLLSMFDDEFSYLLLDDHNGYQPAGVGRFARSAGGHLNDDLASGRVGTLSALDTWICEFAAIEQGAMLQNLGLMAAALGLGGFPHFAAHPFIWPITLGFRTEQTPVSKVLGLPSEATGGLAIPTPVGLERDGETLLKAFCPPYYRDMEEAVLAFVDYKYASGRGTFRDGGTATGWRDPVDVQNQIPHYSDRAIEATIACCRYIYGRHGRFPAATGPFRTVLAYQSHRLDPDFYGRFYRDEAWNFGGRESGRGK
jgi:hypothetical protein